MTTVKELEKRIAELETAYSALKMSAVAEARSQLIADSFIDKRIAALEAAFALAPEVVQNVYVLLELVKKLSPQSTEGLRYSVHIQTAKFQEALRAVALK